MARSIADIAAIIHADMCNDERNGYSWEPRYGGDHPDGRKTLVIDGRPYTYRLGSYDCSSSVCTAWQLALQGTGYEGALDGATYTGNMRSVFVNSGLFEVWNTDNTNAERGDVYLNDGAHTAMCQSGANPDTLSEFCINENGEVYGGSVGDQTGRESYIHALYSYPWSCTLHYNGKADGSQGGSLGVSAPNGEPGRVDVPMPRYRSAYMKDGVKKWYDWLEGLVDTGGSGDDFAGEEGVPCVDFEFENLGEGGWFQLNVQGVGDLPRNKQNDTGKPVIGVTVYYATPNPEATGYYRAMYRVHTLNGSWLKWEYDDEDGGAGDDANAVDMFQLTLSR